MRRGIRAVWAASALSVALVAGAAQAAVLPPIVSSVADYEPRLVRPTSAAPGTGFAIDTNIDTPSDADNLRIGGQSRFRIGSAYFFALPALAAGESVANAGLRFTQIPDSAATGTVPVFNADLRVVGITQDISVANDPDSPQVAETVNPALSALLYNDTATDDRDGIGTPLPRVVVQDNFLTPAQYLANGSGANAVRETNALAGLTLAGYLNALYASGVPASSFLIVTLNPDAPPDDVINNRYQLASANAAAGLQPTLTIDVVPEPSALGLLGLAAAGLLARRRRA
jgi:hypothetical protein